MLAILKLYQTKEMLKLENLNKPSNKKWKAVADFFLYTLPLYLVAIMAIPISEDAKLWLNFGFSIVIVSLKGLTKFTSE
jgi:predicted phosphoadenosine phosphosulfate sulfurtransferase